MIRTLATLGAVLATAGAASAEGGAIRSGEHAGFSRIVMEIDPTTEWSLELAPGSATIFFPQKAIDFGTRDVFERIPRTRITAVESRVEPAGTTVSVAIDCDCRVSTAFVNARHLALDISDRDTPPAPAATLVDPAPDPEPEAGAETAEARDSRERAAVSSAEEILLRQIERAAGQGLIELAPASPAGDGPMRALANAPPPPPRPGIPPRPAMPVALDRTGLPQVAGLRELLEQDQIRATTVFDRDRPAISTRSVEAPLPVECRPDGDFAVAGWADGRPAHRQIADLAGRLLGEFDTPDPVVLEAMARIQVRFGLGAEAEQLLGAIEVPLAARPLLVDLARAVEGRPPLPGGPLSVGAACPGAHGLWLAVAGTGPAYRDAAHFAGIGAALAELPPDLRALVGPGLIGRLIDEGHPDAARRIYDTTVRPDPHRSAALILAEARLVAAEGSPGAAIRELGDLVESNAANASEALRHLARLAIDTGTAIPERLVMDLAAEARLLRATPQGPVLRALLAEALAARGDLAGAVRELRTGMADTPSDPRFGPLAVTILGAADPATAGAAAYAEAILANRSLLPETPEADDARRAIARHLLHLGLAADARALVSPAVLRGEAQDRLVEAEAALALGDGAGARAALETLEGEVAAALRARAFVREGAFDAAVSELAGAGLESEADALAWPSGDWQRAADASVETDPARAAMARFMEVRADPSRAPAPAPDPATLTPAAAFVEPVPRLDPPSLAAARRLLATGREVEDFVAELLRTP